jgi:hypothetical protein
MRRVYESDDGQYFNDEAACREHEAIIARRRKWQAHLAGVAREVLSDDCMDRDGVTRSDLTLFLEDMLPALAAAIGEVKS